jgi:coenzyme F420 hydrogenase subunit beta
MTTARTIDDVVAKQLCTGCGVCSYLSPRTLGMADVPELGRRPLRRADAGPEDAPEAFAACPGAHLDLSPSAEPDRIRELSGAWGPVLRVWEAYASDMDIRRTASSGGAAGALALFCMERRGMHGTLHIRGRSDDPTLNEPTLSRTKADLLRASGSRYAPASPCEALDQVENAPSPCVFIGKPCDVAATFEARRLRPSLDAKLGLTIAIFCAGVPSTRGTRELYRKVGVPDGARILETRYRGNGWPGRWVVRFVSESGAVEERSQSYEESWAFLQKYRQWRCYICPDHTGEFADVSVGDPWYRPIEPGEPGKSLIVARTRRGLEIVQAAAAAGYVVLESEDPSLLPRSQPNLLHDRGVLWGRLSALRLLLLPRPSYRGFSMFRFWWTQLTLRERITSFLGTARRSFTKRLRKRVVVPPLERRVAEDGRR